MADATVIVQHIASVAIFCCCFVAIAQDRVSPVSVVSWASLCTVLGWGLWDYWVGQEEAKEVKRGSDESTGVEDASAISHGLGLTLPSPEDGSVQHSHNGSVSSNSSNISGTSNPEPAAASESFNPPGYQPTYVDPTSSLSPRNQQRLETAKSALLIYAALLGLSPILKSLTRSTTSDSIWALSTWLLCMNVAFFDYGEGTGAQ
jgi:phosphatidylinositol glycan class C protein